MLQVLAGGEIFGHGQAGRRLFLGGIDFADASHQLSNWDIDRRNSS
jgi:hypothetical protein